HQADVVISCIASRTGEPSDAWAVDCEANQRLLTHAVRMRARQFVFLSAICVQKPLLEFQRAKLAFERELRDAPLDHSIVRPTAFFKSLAGQIGRVREGRPYLLLGNGQMTACAPISERDLATFIVDCVCDPSKRNSTLPIGGPGPVLTPREQGQMLFRLLNAPERFRSVPLWFFDAIVAGLRIAGIFSKRIRAKYELARIGRYYATESMLHWDSAQERYRPELTPSFGSESLEDFYRRAIERDDPSAELGDHSVF
ncbi:MAG: NAD(P)H-binding protein, partial [Myxococcota bacterium]